MSKKITSLNLVFAFAIIIGLFADIYYDIVCSIAVVSISFFIILIKLSFSEIKKLKPLGGYANWVTGFRLLNLFVLIGFLNFLSPITIGIWCLAMISLDGVDGYLARKFKTSSDFGAQFDMESDSFFVAAISLILYKLNLVEFWILIPGFMRYIYLIIVFMFCLNDRKEKLSRWSKHIAVLFFISLILPFLVIHQLSEIVLIISSILIIYSFGFAFTHRILEKRAT